MINASLEDTPEWSLFDDFANWVSGGISMGENCLCITIYRDLITLTPHLRAV